MPRIMSFAKTTEQLEDGTKRSTLRAGWANLKPGDLVTAVNRSPRSCGPYDWHVMGDLKITSNERVKLGDLTQEDVELEGFPELTPRLFVARYCAPRPPNFDLVVNQIRFLPTPESRKKLRWMSMDRRWAVEKPLRPLLINEAPNRNGESWPALTGVVGDRLAKLANLSVPTALRLMRVSERVNLLQRWPGSAGKSSLFPMDVARRKAFELLERVWDTTDDDRSMLLVGRRVADAFHHELDYFEFDRWKRPGPEPNDQTPTLYVAAVPHPSRVNRWWNDVKNEDRARDFLTTFFESQKDV